VRLRLETVQQCSPVEILDRDKVLDDGSPRLGFRPAQGTNPDGAFLCLAFLVTVAGVTGGFLLFHPLPPVGLLDGLHEVLD
jgi:hypothetical protein